MMVALIMGRPKKEIKAKKPSYGDGGQCMMCEKRQEHFSGVCHRCRKTYGVKNRPQIAKKKLHTDATGNKYFK